MKVEYASQPLADASDAGSSRVVEDAPVAVVGDTVLGDTVGDAVGAVPPSPPPPVHAVASRSIPLTATKALTLVRSMGTLIPRGALLAITGRLRSAPSARKRCTTSNRGDHPEQALLPSWPLPHSPSNMSSESASRPAPPLSSGGPSWSSCGYCIVSVKLGADKPRREAARMTIFVDPGGLPHRGPSRKYGDRKHPADSSLPLVEVWCTSGNDGPQPVSLGGAGDTRVHVVIMFANSDPAGAHHSEVTEPLRSLLRATHP